MLRLAARDCPDVKLMRIAERECCRMIALIGTVPFLRASDTTEPPPTD